MTHPYAAKNLRRLLGFVSEGDICAFELPHKGAPITIRARDPSHSRPHHSSLMFDARISRAHFSVSSAMNCLNSAGERANGEPPRSARRAFTLGSARAALISLLSLSTIVSGVSRGAQMPYHALISKPGMKSAMVGRSGSTPERAPVVTANARTLPALMYAIALGTVTNIAWIYPHSRSIGASAPPR